MIYKGFIGKKVLSLVLCVAVMLSVMVLGTGAAFSDQDQIENTEAVEMATALKIISGYEDGTYHPERNIKRSEMCKMICIALNGGKEPATATKPTPTFSDIGGHWAEGYIEYCYAQGVVSGVGDGRFNPDGNVTVTQAAKMLLVALGYNADVEHFNGSNWSLYVNVKANQDGIYEGLETIDTAAALNRDQAAQMVWNAMQAKVIEKTSSIDVTTGEVTESYKKGEDTMLADKYNATIYEGVLKASGSVAPYATSHTGESAGKDKLHVTAEYIDGDLAVNGSGIPTLAPTTLKSTIDCTDLLGEYVKVVYSNKDKETLGVFSIADENTVVETNRDAMEVIADVTASASVEINDVEYDFETGAEVFIATRTSDWSADTSSYFATDNRNDNYVKLVDNDGNGKIDVVLVIEAELETVNYVGTDTMTLTTLGSVKKADMNLADEAYEVGDKVMVTPKAATYNGNYGIAKAEVVEGKVTAVKTADITTAATNDVTAVQINGEWYTLCISSTNATLPHSSASIVSDDNGNALALNNTYKLYIRNGYVYAADIVLSGASSIGVITGVTSNTDFDGNTLLRMIKSDGTTVEAYMDWAGSYAPAGGFQDGAIVAYTVSDDVYTLYPLGNTSDTSTNDVKAAAGFDNFVGVGTDLTDSTNDPVASAAAFVAASGSTAASIAGKRINDNAVIFVQYDSNTGKTGGLSWKVLSGKEVNAWKTNYGVNGAGAYMNTGLGFLDVAVITAADGTALPGSNSQYAYVTSTISESEDYVTYSIFDGTSEKSVEVTEKVSSTVATKGAVISFDWDGEGVIKNVAVVSNRGALTYTNGEQVKINGTGYDVADDVVILNVKTADKVGVPGSAILKAQMTTTPDLYYQNVAYKLNSDGEISVLVIDIDGNWAGTTDRYDDTLGAVTVPTNATKGDIETALTNGAVNLDEALDAPISGLEVKADQTLTISAAQTQKLEITAKNGATINVGAAAQNEKLEITVEEGANVVINGTPVTGTGGVFTFTAPVAPGDVPASTIKLSFVDGKLKVDVGTNTVYMTKAIPCVVDCSKGALVYNSVTYKNTTLVVAADGSVTINGVAVPTMTLPTGGSYTVAVKDKTVTYTVTGTVDSQETEGVWGGWATAAEEEKHFTEIILNDLSTGDANVGIHQKNDALKFYYNGKTGSGLNGSAGTKTKAYEAPYSLYLLADGSGNTENKEITVELYSGIGSTGAFDTSNGTLKLTCVVDYSGLVINEPVE